MTQRLDKINNDIMEKVRGANSNLTTHKPEAQSKNKNEHSNSNKMGRLEYVY